MGYTLVGCAIAHAAGQSYADYVRENVFLSAGMPRSQVDDRFTIIPYRTRFYHRDSTGAVVNADFLDASYKVPGGGWLSDADDLAHFESALFHDALLKRSTRTVMWTEQKTNSDSLTGYSLGWGSARSGVPAASATVVASKGQARTFASTLTRNLASCFCPTWTFWT
jgi:serine beta-lactamase-like protein LACTB